MELEEEYSRNRVKMKKIKKQATIMTVFYALYLAFILSYYLKRFTQSL